MKRLTFQGGPQPVGVACYEGNQSHRPAYSLRISSDSWLKSNGSQNIVNIGNSEYRCADSQLRQLLIHIVCKFVCFNSKWDLMIIIIGSNSCYLFSISGTSWAKEIFECLRIELYSLNRHFPEWKITFNLLEWLADKQAMHASSENA